MAQTRAKGKLRSGQCLFTSTPSDPVVPVRQEAPVTRRSPIRVLAPQDSSESHFRPRAANSPPSCLENRPFLCSRQGIINRPPPLSHSPTCPLPQPRDFPLPLALPIQQTTNHAHKPPHRHHGSSHPRPDDPLAGPVRNGIARRGRHPRASCRSRGSKPEGTELWHLQHGRQARLHGHAVVLGCDERRNVHYAGQDMPPLCLQEHQWHLHLQRQHRRAQAQLHVFHDFTNSIGGKCCTKDYHDSKGISGRQWSDQDFNVVVAYGNCNHGIDSDKPAPGPKNDPWGPNGLCEDD